MQFVCMLEDKAQTDDMDEHDVVHSSVNKKGGVQRWQGKLSYPIVGLASLRPCSIGDLDEKAKKRMTEEQIKHRVTSADDGRKTILTEVMKEPVSPPPGLVQLEEPSDQRTDKRVSLTNERLTKVVLSLFQSKQFWTIEEISQKLNHPKEPINKLMKEIGVLDPIRKWYTLREHF